MKLKEIIISGLLIIGYIGAMVMFAKTYYADMLFVASEDALSEGEKALALETINLAILSNPNEPNYYRQRAKTYIASTTDVKSEENIDTLKRLGLNDLVTALELNPNNLATIRNTAPLYFFLANKDLTKPSSPENIDQTYLPITKEYLLQMQNYVPEDVGVQVLSAKYQKRLHLDKDHANSIERIKSLRPDLLNWYTGIN